LSLPMRWGPYAVILLLVIPLALWAKVSTHLLRSSLPIILPFALSVFIIQGLFWQEGPILAELGPLSFKTEGVLFAISSTGRILCVITSFLLLSFTTRPDDLMIALSQRGLPPALTYVVLSTIQIVPRFRARAQTILDAQQSRGLSINGNPLQRARALVPLVVPLVLSSIVDVEERAIALEARAFTRSVPKTSYRSIEDSQIQQLIRWAIIVLAVSAPLSRILLVFL
ncbi:MAG: energy-coupling factor transporter transmembrane component T, partial [Anaerolineales bacterium]